MCFSVTSNGSKILHRPQRKKKTSHKPPASEGSGSDQASHGGERPGERLLLGITGFRGWPHQTGLTLNT